MKMPGDARWTVLGLLFLGGMINYLDRSAIGVAAPFLAKQLSLSPSELGWVFSVFFFGYAAFCFVGGSLPTVSARATCSPSRRSSGLYSAA